MFGDFNFSSGLSQLANLDISQKFEQIKKDLEANISSHIDHDALTALTGEGIKGDDHKSADLASLSTAEPGKAIMPPPAESAPQHAASQSTAGSVQQQQAASSSVQQAGPEADSISPVAAPPPPQRSLRHPKSPRSPAAQRRANARAKPDAAGAQGIRRLGAEPMGGKGSLGRHSASLPAAQSDGREDGGSPEPIENGNRHSTVLDASHMQHELQPDSRSGATHRSSDSAISDLANGDTEGWEGDIEDSADQGLSEPHGGADSAGAQSNRPAGIPHGQPEKQEASEASSAADLPSHEASNSEHGSGVEPADAAPQQSIKGLAAGLLPIDQQETGLHLEHAVDMATSSVEKPETPPRLASPKSPQPAASAAGEENGSTKLPGSSPDSTDVKSVSAQPVPEAQPPKPSGGESKDVASLDLEAAQQLVVQLRASLQARELQLERKQEEVASMQDATQQVMARNEELARKSAAISEEDLEAVRAEFEARLGAAERKVYALTKERDALRRGADRLVSANDLLKEKDAIIQQVMEEGERLSKKQLAQENTIKKLRAELAEARSDKGSTSASLAAERQKVDTAQAAKQKAEEQVTTLKQSHKAEMEAEKLHYEALLQKARSAQVEAEQAARATAKEGLGRKLREAEARAESLAETVEELRAGLDRQRAAADYREDMLKRELADITRRGQAAEERHEELASALPEATRPLLRQIEAMQASAAANSQAWATVEHSLEERLSAAEARAAASGEKERAANERAQAATSRQAALHAALDAAREEASRARQQAEEAHQALMDAQHSMKSLEEQMRSAQTQLSEAVAAKEHAEAAAWKLRAGAEHSASAALAAAEARCADLEERLRAAQASAPAGQLAEPTHALKDSAGNRPPAMAGPGCRWVLVKEGAEPRSAPVRQDADRDAQPMRRGGSFSSQLDMATGLSGEGSRLHDLVKQRNEQINALQQQILGLERTRDSLAEELVSAAQAVESGKEVERRLSSMQAEHSKVMQRLREATELLGEKEEHMAELAADVADLRQMYREQVEVFVEQMAQASQHSTPQPSPRPSVSS